MDSHLLGRFGEIIASRYLRCHGYDIAAAHYNCRLGEIDIVAEDKKYICFVEVKLRGAGSIALPREFVDVRKQERLRKTAAAYLSSHDLDVPARFDVAEVYEEQDGTLRIQYLESAFE